MTLAIYQPLVHATVLLYHLLLHIHSIVDKDLAARIVGCSDHPSSCGMGRVSNTQTEQLVLTKMSNDEEVF